MNRRALMTIALAAGIYLAATAIQKLLGILL